MRLGFLHFGAPQHGVSRYGRLLAAEAATRPRLEVVAIEARSEPLDALAGCDVVVAQYSRSLVGDDAAARESFTRLLATRGRRTIVFLHDVYAGDPWEGFRKQAPSLARRMRRWLSDRAQRAELRRIVARSAASLVCFDAERERLGAVVAAADRRRIEVVPHFVETRPRVDRAAARARLAVEDRLVLTVLGWIHRRKGHDLVVDALDRLDGLPTDPLVIFAGAAAEPHREYRAALERRAARAGFAHRLRITGWLEEAALDDHLAATDLAICPFRFFSASGSLATWIAAGRPVLAHALPQVEEYRALAPSAFSTFAPYEPAAFAAAVAAVAPRLATERTTIDGELAALRERFSLAATVDRLVAIAGRVSGAE
jgi:glycosyltransferase involved in cell wall biosynthesis